MFTAIARLLALFDFSPARDADGSPIIPSDESTNGSITYVFPGSGQSCLSSELTLLI